MRRPRIGSVYVAPWGTLYLVEAQADGLYRLQLCDPHVETVWTCWYPRDVFTRLEWVGYL